MATLNVVKILCEDDNDNKKRHSHLDNGNADVVVACPPDSQCDLEPILSKRKKKKWIKMQRQITNLVTDNDAPINIRVDTKTGTGRDSIARRKKKKLMRMQRQITNLVTENDAPINIRVDTKLGTDDSVGNNSCRDSLVQINAKTDSDVAAEPVLISSKRKRKKKKLNASGITNEVNVSLADVNLPGTKKSALPSEKQNVNLPGREESALPFEKQSESPREPVLISSKRKRKKKKLNASGITNEVNVSLADVNLPGTEKSALPSEKQSESPRSSIVNMHNGEAALGLVENDTTNRKRKRGCGKKKNTSVINDNAHADLDVVGMERNGLPSETQSDTTILSVDVVEKHDNNGDAALISDRIANIRQKSKRRRDKKKLNKAHVPPVELDRSGEENALVRGKESNSCSTSSSNQGSACILVEKENTKTNHIEGKLRRSKKKSKSSNPERNMQPTTVAAEVAAEVNVLGNLLAEKTSSNCLIESMDIINIKKSTDLSFSVEKHKFQQVACPRVGAPVGYSGKKLLILDLNGLLADIVIHSERERKADIVISKKAVFRRPFCHDFLQFCFEKFNVGIWSSRIRKNVDMVVNFLMADSRHKLLFCWDQSHCTNTGFKTLENRGKPLVLKELKKLWDKLVDGLPWNKGDYNESNTLLLDDSPYKALRNPANTAIFPYPYVHSDTGDSSLGPGGDLRVYLEKLAEAQNVQEFIAHNPFGQPAITESSGKWSFYKKIVR